MIRAVIGHYDFRPVHHGGGDEGQRMPAQRERIAVFDHDAAVKLSVLAHIGNTKTAVVQRHADPVTPVPDHGSGDQSVDLMDIGRIDCRTLAQVRFPIPAETVLTFCHDQFRGAFCPLLILSSASLYRTQKIFV